MVMTTGNRNIRKTGTNTPTMDGSNEMLNPSVQDVMEQVGVVGTSVSDNIDMITSNDHDDVFYGPAPKIALTLDRTLPAVETSDKIWEEIKQKT